MEKSPTGRKLPDKLGYTSMAADRFCKADRLLHKSGGSRWPMDQSLNREMEGRRNYR